MLNHPYGLFPGDPAIRAIARDQFAGVKNLPLVRFADDKKFATRAQLLVVADHAEHYCLCRGKPTRWWLDQAFENPSGIESPLDPNTVTRRPSSDKGCDGPKRTDKVAALSPFAGAIRARGSGLRAGRKIHWTDWKKRVSATRSVSTTTETRPMRPAGRLRMIL